MPRTSRDPETRRQELVDAAQSLFLEHGFAATSVAAIVRRVGVAQGTFYYHFPSKEAVGDAVIDQWIDAIHGRLAAALGEATDAPTQLRRLLAALGRVMEGHRQVIASLMQPSNDGLHARFAERFGSQLLTLFEQLVARGIAAGSFRIEHPRETLEFLLAGLAHLTRAHGPGVDPAALPRLYAATETLFLRALAAAVHT